MSHPYKSQCSDHRKNGHSLYKAEGGQVVGIPFSVEKTADAMKRLSAAGAIANKSHTADYAASRLKKEGYDPVKIIGTEAKYRKGGRT